MTRLPEIKKKYNLIAYRTLDLVSFGRDLQLHLEQAETMRNLKIFGSNEKGIIVLSPQYNGYNIYYLIVKEQFRYQGVCRDLIDSALVYCRRYRKVLTMRIVFNNSIAAALERYAINRKMILISGQKIFILKRKMLDNEKGMEWIGLRMKNVADRFLNNGYKISSFRKAPAEILDKLKYYFDNKNIKGMETPADMHPFSHRNDTDFSFVCWKESEPVSYICAERYGDSLVAFEFFCFIKYFGLGVSIVPLQYFSEAAMMDKSINRVSFMILDTNKLSLRMLYRDYSKFNPAVTVQKVYAGPGDIIKVGN